MAGFSRMQGGGDSFQVTHFADQDDVGILTERSAQGGSEGRSIDADFALVHVSLFVAVQEFDGIFDGDDMFGAGRVHAIDHGRQRGGLTGTSNAGDEHQTARHVADLLDDLGEKQFIQGSNFGGNDAEDQSHVAALLEDIDTEAPQAGDAVGHVEFGNFFELLFLPVGHHAESHVQHVFRGNAWLFCERHQFAIHAHVRIVANFQMKVGGFTLHRNSEQIINVHISLVPKNPLGHMIEAKHESGPAVEQSICVALLIGCNVARSNWDCNRGACLEIAVSL